MVSGRSWLAANCEAPLAAVMKGERRPIEALDSPPRSPPRLPGVVSSGGKMAWGRSTRSRAAMKLLNRAARNLGEQSLARGPVRHWTYRELSFFAFDPRVPIPRSSPR